jgi:hypothetical protein
LALDVDGETTGSPGGETAEQAGDARRRLFQLQSLVRLAREHVRDARVALLLLQDPPEVGAPVVYDVVVSRIHGRAFVVAIDGVGKALKRLRTIDEALPLDEVIAGFEAATRWIPEVRHSILHAEDRVLRRRRDESIDVKPVDVPGVISSGVPLLVLDTVSRDADGNFSFVSMIESGETVQVALTVEMLAHVEAAITEAASIIDEYVPNGG